VGLEGTISTPNLRQTWSKKKRANKRQQFKIHRKQVKSCGTANAKGKDENIKLVDYLYQINGLNSPRHNCSQGEGQCPKKIKTKETPKVLQGPG